MSDPSTFAGVDLWQRAASFAARMHASQRRKDGVTPYIAHPARVALIVRDVFDVDDPVCIAAALLHDTIEDTPADYDDVLIEFGDEVARTVAALTKDMRLPEAERERAYDDQLARAPWRARLIKLADAYDNLCDRLTRSDMRSPRRGIDRAGRAIAIAQPIAGEHEAVARAIAALQALVAEHERLWAQEKGPHGDASEVTP